MARDGEKSKYLFPRLPGTYALISRLEEDKEIDIGRLGTFSFKTGEYIYIGSALGPGGLAGRLGRHLEQDRRVKRWHIDYLTEMASIRQVWYCQSEHRYEHEWAGMLSRLESIHIPVSRFGASDCRCPAHLFYFDGPVLPAMVEQQLKRRLSKNQSLDIVDIEQQPVGCLQIS